MNRELKLRNLKREYVKKWKYVLMITPSVFLMFLFGIYPNISVFWMSLYDWSPIRTEKIFVGLHNYIIMFTVDLQDTFQKAGNTLIYIGGLFLIQTVLSLILALALQKNTKGNKFFRAYFFLPMVFSTTMVSMTWAFMYDPNLGVINNIMAMVGAGGFPGKYLFSENWQAVLLIVCVHIWANIGYPITILISGLSTMSEEIKEAAMIDGANSIQLFTKITFPQLMPTILRLSLLTVTTGAMASDYVVMIGNRNSIKPYDTWSASMYKQIMTTTDYGGVSASAVLMFVLLATASLIQLLVMRKVEKSVLG